MQELRGVELSAHTSPPQSPAAPMNRERARTRPPRTWAETVGEGELPKTDSDASTHLPRWNFALGCSSGIREERMPTRTPFHVRQTRERTTAVWKRPSRQKSEIPPKLVKSALSLRRPQRAWHSPREARTVVGVPKAARALRRNGWRSGCSGPSCETKPRESTLIVSDRAEAAPGRSASAPSVAATTSARLMPRPPPAPLPPG